MIFSDYSVKRCLFVFKRNVYLSSMHNKTGEKKGGGSQILDWTYARGGGGSFRCVLGATRGVGGSKNQEKMRM